MAIQWYEKSTPARDLVFDKVPFWVQVYDIPFRFANKVVAEGICSGIGEVCPSDFSVMEGSDFMRVRVILDISKPLSRGRKITLDDGSVGWVSFKYEYYQISAIGVVVLLIVTKIVIFGLTVKAPCLWKLVNMERGCEHLCLIQSENPQWLFRVSISRKKKICIQPLLVVRHPHQHCKIHRCHKLLRQLKHRR